MASDSEFTLPDYLRPGLDIVFVGINPGTYSSKVGKYFATPQNRFWPALSRSGIANASRPLVPGDEAWLCEAGIGFTDVVKRASSSASDLRAADFRTWAPLAKRKLEQAAPLVVCFNGLTGYRWYMQYAEGGKVKPALGPQRDRLGVSTVFVAPNPSPANATYSLDVIAEWYRKLGVLRDQLKPAAHG
jgi:TDG/mug DNA glycosylase family protein